MERAGVRRINKHIVFLFPSPNPAGEELRKFNRLDPELDERGVVVGQRMKHSNWGMAELKLWLRQRV
jgi:hypothetical protein